MPSLKLRHSVRAIILTEDHRVLLCRHRLAEPVGAGVWAAPGGGVEVGETPLAALRRELREEVGLAVEAGPPQVWHREVVAPGHVPGYDGAIQDYYLVHAEEFAPRGTMSEEELAAENISELRWWSLPDIAAYRGPDLFAPRELARLLTVLITHGVPAEPTAVGW